jgi:sugar O-acyltransferase (sialic acid O-acetyltransferase NeuD family)
MKRPFIVIGAGGHGAVVADALLRAGHTVLGFLDGDPAHHGRRICGVPVLGDDAVLNEHRPDQVMLANGIGGTGQARSAGLRQEVQRRLSAKGWQFAGACHPAAIVSPFAEIAMDAQLLAASVVQPHASIGAGCIVNTAAVLEHHVTLAEFVHVAPGAVVCGNVQIGARSHIGAGAVVRQGLRLGSDTVVAAGAVVVKDFDGPVLLMGVPARAVEPGS